MPTYLHSMFLEGGVPFRGGSFQPIPLVTQGKERRVKNGKQDLAREYNNSAGPFHFIYHYASQVF